MVFLIVMAMGLTVVSPANAEVDTTGPVLLSSSASPTTFNLQNGPAVVKVSLHLTDETGASAPYLTLDHSGTDQSSGFGSMTLASGTTRDGTWERTMTIPQGSATGQWDVVLYPLKDTLRNSSTSFKTIATLTVDGEPADTAGPVLVSSSASPTTFNLQNGPAVVKVSLHLTDRTGVSAPYLTLDHSGTGQSSGFGSMTLVSGTTRDGTWERTMTIPQGSATGQWDVVLYPLKDTLGNSSTSFKTIATLTVEGEPADTAGPVLVSSSASPTTFNLQNGPAVVKVSLHLTDRTGASAPYLTLDHSGTDQSSGFGSMTLASGTTRDGTWERTMTIPQGSATGQWDVVLYPLKDTLGNSSTFFQTIASLTLHDKTEVTAAPVVFADKDGTAEDTYTIPTTEGVDYLIGDKIIEAGTYPATGTITVTARARSGYLLSAGTATEWTTAFTPLPVTAAPVTISGTPKVGYLLTAVPGTWGPAPVALAYQWFRSGIAITGATAEKYTVSSADMGKTVVVQVTGSKTGYTSVSKASTATAVIAAGTLGPAPAPAITGTKKVGYTLTAYPGTWGPAPVTIRYQWHRAGVAITGATAATYRLTGADAGRTLSIRVTGAKTGYTSVTKASTATAVIAAGTLGPAPAPAITGTKKVGYTLTAYPGTWGPAPVTIRYQWYRNGLLISGAISRSYKLSAIDAGKVMQVRVVGSKAGYVLLARLSTPTAKIIR